MLLGNRWRLQAALAEVSMPEETRGDGTPRAPWNAERFKLFRRRPLAKLLHFLNGRGEREIASWPDIRTAQGAQEINVGGPLADAFEGDEHFARGIVVEVMQIAQIE